MLPVKSQYCDICKLKENCNSPKTCSCEKFIPTKPLRNSK